MLTEKQKNCALELAQGRFSLDVIAGRYGITNRTLYNWRKDEEFQKYYKQCFDSLFLEASAEALKTILSLMENAESETVKLNACKDILSRAGFDATAKSKQEITTPEDIVINIV